MRTLGDDREGMSAFGTIAAVAIAMLTVLSSATASTADDEPPDQITLRSDSGGRISIRCFIIDYTGKEITFRTSLAAQKKSRSADTVLAVKTPQSKSHVAGLVHYTRKQYDEAQISFEKALPLEDREWVRRELLAMLIRCALKRGDFQSACTRYVLLIQSDPETRHQHLLPLVWGPRDLKNELKAKARSWVNDSRSTVQLIGASILLSDARSVEPAKRTLTRLTRTTPRRTRDLARMQLWRDRLRRGSINRLELDDWQSQVDALDESMRGGPYYLLGVAHRNRRESEQAAAAFLWLPLVYDHDHHLAARACIEAADALVEVGRKTEALSLYEEVRTRFGQTTFAQEAVAQIEKLKAPSSTGQ